MPEDELGAVEPENLGPPEYLAYCILSEYKEKGSGELSRTEYHKLTIFADKYLQDSKSINVGLPTHWYFYGETIQESEFEEQIAFSPMANHGDGRAYYPADRISLSDFSHIPADLRDQIFAAARYSVDKYGDKSWNELEELMYHHYAPNDFVRAYGNLRDILSGREEAESGQRFLDSYTEDQETTEIIDALDNMLSTFPRDKYDKLYDAYLLWDDTFRLLADRGETSRTLRAFLEEMIEAVSVVYLRFQHNQNTSVEAIHKWSIEAKNRPSEFKSLVEAERSRALRDREQSGELDEVAESFNETILSEIEETD